MKTQKTTKNVQFSVVFLGYLRTQRREGDSNPRFRGYGTTVFETAAFNHSAISPLVKLRNHSSRNVIWRCKSNYFDH